MQVVILAGGRGERLRPLTDQIPKPMAMVGEKPFLLLIVERLSTLGFKDFLLCVGYKHQVIMDFFKDGRQFGVNILYSIEEEPLGTAGAVLNAQKLLNEEFLLLNGDTYLTLDYRDLEAAGSKSDTICKMVTYMGYTITDAKFNAQVDSSNFVVRYDKNRQDELLNAVDAGAYFMRKSILSYIPATRASLEHDVFDKLAKKRQLCAFRMQERYYDIGTIHRLEEFSSYHNINVK